MRGDSPGTAATQATPGTALPRATHGPVPPPQHGRPQEHPPATESGHEAGAGRGTARRTVLVVDDDATTVEFLTVALEEEGYRVLAGVGGEALRLAREERPAVILLDLMMPQMDGPEVCRRLRAEATTARIPIVAMSAHDRLSHLAGTMAVNDQLAKPFHIGDLFAKVARWAQ